MGYYVISLQYSWSERFEYRSAHAGTMTVCLYTLFCKNGMNGNRMAFVFLFATW